MKSKYLVLFALFTINLFQATSCMKVATLSSDGTVRIWDVQTGKELQVIRDEGLLSFACPVAWSPNGKIAAIDRLGAIVVFDAKTGKKLKVLEGHEEWGRSVAWSSDGKKIASGASDKTVRIWDAKTGDELKVLRGHMEEVNSVAWSSDGKKVASAGSVDHTVRIWDLETGRDRVLGGDMYFVSAVAWISRKKVVSGSWDRAVRIWDLETGGCNVSEKYKRSIRAIACSPDGRKIVIGFFEGAVMICDAKTGQNLQVLEGHNGNINSIAWSPDGKKVASGASDETVKIWDVKTGRCESILKGHTEQVYSVAFCPIKEIDKDKQERLAFLGRRQSIFKTMVLSKDSTKENNGGL